MLIFTLFLKILLKTTHKHCYLLSEGHNHHQDVHYLDYSGSAATIKPHSRHIRNHRSVMDLDVKASEIAPFFKVAGE